MRLVFRLRPFKWFVRIDWYSRHRWGVRFGDETYWLLDLGAITIGVNRHNNQVQPDPMGR